ncbi:DUF6483 family protein [bacterium BMS3Abin03]|nr:DUF6483 family protein [bacterium BMS3Abin03]
MIQQDYIMRMIEQLVQVLAKLLFNKEAKNYNDALNDIDIASKIIVGLDFELLAELSAKDIKSLLALKKDDSTVNIKLIIIAKLIKEKTEILKLTSPDNPKIIPIYQKAISLYLEGILNNKNTEIDLSRFYQDIEEIENILKDEINTEIRFNLFKFYDHSGNTAKAGKELIKLKEMNYPDIEKVGINFFKKLEKLSKEDL